TPGYASIKNICNVILNNNLKVVTKNSSLKKNLTSFINPCVIRNLYIVDVLPKT
ncbi:hypothetical protein IRJ41_003000, partial [Triplophysa rosa]